MVGGVGWGGCGVTWFLFGRLVHRPDGLQIHPRADNKQPSEGSRDWACPAAVPSSFVIALRGGVARRPINGANGDPERHTRCNLPPPLTSSYSAAAASPAERRQIAPRFPRLCRALRVLLATATAPSCAAPRLDGWPLSSPPSSWAASDRPGGGRFFVVLVLF